jgi:ABC-type transporter Mla subunit MlaD
VVAFFQYAFDQLGGAVILLLVADEDERFVGCHPGGGGEGDGAQLRAGDAIGIDRYAVGQEFAQLRQDIRLGFEAVLVEVVVALASAAEGELAAQERDLGDALGQL